MIRSSCPNARNCLKTKTPMVEPAIPAEKSTVTQLEVEIAVLR